MSLFGKKDSAEPGTVGEVKTRNKVGKRSYGIAETTLLMRTLPVDQNVELVVRVVRNTLESMDVQLPDIIEDAQQREGSLQERMDTLNGEIAEFTSQIDLRRQEITPPARRADRDHDGEGAPAAGAKTRRPIPGHRQRD